MSGDRGSRRLAAVMFTDIVGYTALMAENEELGVRVRERHRNVVRGLVERYGGDSIEATGDETLSTFESALDAVNCALSVQESLLEDPELRVRIGVHSGDVVFADGEVRGDGVNLAARVRPLPSRAEWSSRRRCSSRSATSRVSAPKLWGRGS